MAIGALFAVLATLCGLTVVRVLRAPASLAPVSGLAAMAVLATWGGAIGLPPTVRTALVILLAAAGLTTIPRIIETARRRSLSALALAGAVAIPLVLLGVAFANVEAPVSTHDGAFHVETIERLRSGQAAAGWYPLGFHASVAAVLGLTPWLDSARGTFEAAQGLAVLAPLAVFSLALALDMATLLAAGAALILALTWTYPYDYHLWAGWPQGMGVLLLIGLCATALHWTQRPSARLAALAGLFAAAIVLSHGTEVYSAVLALGVIAVARSRRLQPAALARHAALAIVVAVLLTVPYLSALLGWAGAGGAAAAGEAIATGAQQDTRGDWLQFALGVTGAASLIDLPVRIALIGLGMMAARTRQAAAVWAAFVALLLLVNLANVPPVSTLFAVTYPWLDHDRPRQVIVVWASLLAAGGLAVCVEYVKRLRGVWQPRAWRRWAIAGAVLVGFFAEGSAVSVYKKLAQSIAEQNVYTPDSAAAMAWLRQHSGTGEVVANDLAGDAGIWAPYKAGVPILLPRSATGPVFEDREAILEHLLDLQDAPGVEAEACALNVKYLFHSAAPLAFDERMFRDRSMLEQAPGLREVFSSGEASVFRLELACN